VIRVCVLRESCLVDGMDKQDKLKTNNKIENGIIKMLKR
jgi:hypothetical protein